MQISRPCSLGSYLSPTAWEVHFALRAQHILSAHCFPFPLFPCSLPPPAPANMTTTMTMEFDRHTNRVINADFTVTRYAEWQDEMGLMELLTPAVAEFALLQPICSVHERYCNTTALRQYANTTACMNFLNNITLVSRDVSCFCAFTYRLCAACLCCVVVLKGRVASTMCRDSTQACHQHWS